MLDDGELKETSDCGQVKGILDNREVKEILDCGKKTGIFQDG